MTIMQHVRPFLTALVLACLSGCNSAAQPVMPATDAASTGPTDREAYRWRPVAIGGGGFITGLATDRTGATLVARTDTYGAYIWNKAQDRWVQLLSSATLPPEDQSQISYESGAYEVAVAPSDPNRIYMAIKGGRVYRSEDGGQHFVRAWHGAETLEFSPNGKYRMCGPFMIVDPVDPDILMMGTPAQGLWRSADGGRDWTAIASVPPSVDLNPRRDKVQAPGALLWIEPGKRRYWAFSTGHGMFVSGDRGLTFQPLTAAGADGPRELRHGAFTRSGAFIGTDPENRKLWRFANGAWTDISDRLPNDKPARLGAIAVNPANGAIITLGVLRSAYRSTDDGESWNRMRQSNTIGKGDPPWLYAPARYDLVNSTILFDPAVPNRLWVGSGVGPFYADLPGDGVGATLTGIHWTSRARGIEQLVTKDIQQPTGGAPLFAAADFGIHRKPVLDAYSTSYGPRDRVLIAAQAMDWSARHPNIVVTNASDTRVGCCAQDGQSVLAGYSEDGGATWQRFATLPRPPGTKAGDPWAMAFGAIAVSATDPDNILWAPAFNRSPFYTTDRGRSWNRVALPGETLPFTGSFERPNFTRRNIAADRVRGGRFYMLHSGEGGSPQLAGFWRTDDGGAHWERTVTGMVMPGARTTAHLKAVPDHEGHLFLLSNAYQGDRRLRRSIDGGASWTAIDDVTQVEDIAFGKAALGRDYPAIYLTGRVRDRPGVWRSVDNMASWQRIGFLPFGRVDQPYMLGADPDHFGRVYIAYSGSGFVYGEPSRCRPHPFRRDDADDCQAVTP